MKLNKIVSTSIISLTLLGLLNPVVRAETYGGGDNEITLQIVKEVKLDGDPSYKDKVFVDLTKDDQRNKNIVFKVTIKNKGDKVENLKMEDFLPSALEKVSGNLTEEWSSLDKDEVKTFEISAKIKSSEIIADKDYEKCVVNKAELRRDGNFSGSDVATLCYGNKPITSLPSTGIVPVVGMLGLGLVTLGQLIKSNKK